MISVRDIRNDLRKAIALCDELRTHLVNTLARAEADAELADRGVELPRPEPEPEPKSHPLGWPDPKPFSAPPERRR
jgi:hypothetical protein